MIKKNGFYYSRLCKVCIGVRVSGDLCRLGVCYGVIDMCVCVYSSVVAILKKNLLYVFLLLSCCKNFKCC